jgi:hypothetical protein
MEHGQVSTVSGVVTDDAGRPLADVAVAFTRAPVPVPDIAVLTGADGRFVLAAPAPGAYTVAVNAPGHAGRTADLRVDPGGAQEVHVEITVPGGPGGPGDPGDPGEPAGPAGPGAAGGGTELR